MGNKKNIFKIIRLFGCAVELKTLPIIRLICNWYEKNDVKINLIHYISI